MGDYRQRPDKIKKLSRQYQRGVSGGGWWPGSRGSRPTYLLWRGILKVDFDLDEQAASFSHITQVLSAVIAVGHASKRLRVEDRKGVVDFQSFSAEILPCDFRLHSRSSTSTTCCLLPSPVFRSVRGHVIPCRWVFWLLESLVVGTPSLLSY